MAHSWLAQFVLFSAFPLILPQRAWGTSLPTQRTAPHVAASDIQLLGQRRLSNIIGSTTGATSVGSWLADLEPTGQWPLSEIDYTTGCDAQRASWPAQVHWQRLVTLAAAWHGGLANAVQWTKNTTLRSAISSAMGFWFENDFTNPSCLDHGGDDLCPCGTPGFWNTNWFSNVIGIPGFVGEVCVMLNGTLTPSELGNCTKFTSRAYNTFLTGINGVSAITGSNSECGTRIGVDLGIFTGNESSLIDAFGHVHNEVIIENAIKADGIRPDGSFGQHTGIIYNGNYGKDYLNDIFNFEIEAAGTKFQATNASHEAVVTLLQADAWMIFRNVLTNVLHWDYSVLGRIIAIPVADNQATENTKLNFTQIEVLGQEWQSPEVQQVFQDLSLATTDANAGKIEGNRMFFTNDYMIQRGSGYVSTLRMYSKRTQNTECTNSQNPFGFHLADGTLYTHLQGNEYEDIFAAWDWNLIPGITVDYGATPLNCSGARHTGTQALVGGASDGQIGVAAMRYETPTSKTLNWRKTWFFLPNDIQHVMVARITSTTDAPVFSVLDQRRLDGDILVDGKAVTSGNFTGVSALFHGGVGYIFNSSNSAISLSIQSAQRTGAWSTISTSKQPAQSVDLFSAWLTHNDLTVPIDYTIYPATTAASFTTKAANSDLVVIRNDGSISALFDQANNVAMFVFWEAAGGSTTIPASSSSASIQVASTGNIALIVALDNFNLTIADPTQTLSSVTLTFTKGSGTTPSGWSSSSSSADITVQLPSGGLNGSSIFTKLF
ncbi:polysaccharide lyase family 8 protein [Vararia minispora EC-137]|uniref:Polysaccharide lyase family 8 protein n=1 Tax=Vararia minispora EC-137 TaxID=1314806 RepID=A0ACB8QCT5_9AGAM|nr:polysaccharide lyase family 8 protein [Vararia minispora EC-137]